MGATSGIRFDRPAVERLAQDDGWWALYDESFPIDEREPRDVILRSVEQGVGVALRAEIDGETVALATLHLLCDPAIVFLVYLAVNPRLQGNGIGGRILEFSWTVGSRCLSGKGLEAQGLVWEVDDPDATVDAVERARRERRITFFRRHGGELLPMTYWQPPVGEDGPVRMRLMRRSLAPDAAMNPEQTNALVRAIYYEKYGAMNGISREVLDDLLSRDG